MVIMEQSHPLPVALTAGKGSTAVAGPQLQPLEVNELPLFKNQDHNDGETNTDESGSLNSDADVTDSSTTTDGTHHGSHCQHDLQKAIANGKARDIDASAQKHTTNGQPVSDDRAETMHPAATSNSQSDVETRLGDHRLFSSQGQAHSAGKSAVASQPQTQVAATSTASSEQDQGNAKEMAAIGAQHESTANHQDQMTSPNTEPLTEDADDGIEVSSADFSNEQLWGFQEQLDDTTAALAVNVPDEQLWALKLPSAARDVLEFFLRSLACVRIDSPAYEFAAIVKSLVLIALGFGMPISRLACSAGQDWRTCTLTLSDLKITKVTKDKDDNGDEDEDEVFASAKPHDHVVVEICTDKLIGASAKKWILKSSPDLLHTTLTPTSMAPLAEILYEPYNPMETFLETLAWRGLAVDEATGKLFRPANATASNTLRFVTETNDGDVVTPVEPVFHATSRSLARIFSMGTVPLSSFNPNSSPFTQIRASSKPATGLWAATTQPLPKKRLVEYVRSVTQGTGGHRIAEELLGSRSKVLEDEREWTGEVAEDTGAVSDADSVDEVDTAAATRRQQISDAAAFAEEVRRNRAARGSKKKGKGKESSASSVHVNGCRGGFAPPHRTQYYQPPPPPSHRGRRGRHGNYWPPPPPPGPHTAPHLCYGYGYAYPPMGYAQPAYYPTFGGYANPSAARPRPAPRPAGFDVAATTSAPPAASSAPAPSAAHGPLPGTNAEVKADHSSFPDLIRLDDDEEEDEDDSEGLETLPQLPGQRLPPEYDSNHFHQSPEHMVSFGCNGGDETSTPARRDTTYAFSYSLGGEHYIRREPSRVRALIVWRPNTLLEDARKAAERREWSKEDLLGYAKELYDRSANADEQPRSVKREQADTASKAKGQEQSLGHSAKASTVQAASGRQIVITIGDNDGDTQRKDDIAPVTSSTTAIGSSRGTSQQLIIYKSCSLTELVVKAMLSRNVS